jgi:hypothetical protein
MRGMTMKLVRFGERRTGLVVELPTGPHVIDVVASVGTLLPEDPVSSGVLNGILRVCPGTSSGITEFSEHEAD